MEDEEWRDGRTFDPFVMCLLPFVTNDTYFLLSVSTDSDAFLFLTDVTLPTYYNEFGEKKQKQ